MAGMSASMAGMSASTSTDSLASKGHPHDLMNAKLNATQGDVALAPTAQMSGQRRAIRISEEDLPIIRPSGSPTSARNSAGPDGSARPTLFTTCVEEEVDSDTEVAPASSSRGPPRPSRTR